METEILRLPFSLKEAFTTNSPLLVYQVVRSRIDDVPHYMIRDKVIQGNPRYYRLITAIKAGSILNIKHIEVDGPLYLDPRLIGVFPDFLNEMAAKIEINPIFFKEFEGKVIPFYKKTITGDLTKLEPVLPMVQGILNGNFSRHKFATMKWDEDTENKEKEL